MNHISLLPLLTDALDAGERLKNDSLLHIILHFKSSKPFKENFNCSLTQFPDDIETENLSHSRRELTAARQNATM